MPKCKTFEVEILKKKINSRNRQSICSADCRNAWNSILVDVLTETNNYVGFRYLNPDEVPAGELPGIDRTKETAVNRYPDSSRVEYY